jgi:hypothetical protein
MGLRGPQPEIINEQALLSCSPESDYWCGILATDGCIGFAKRVSVPLIRYGGIDIEHVYKFRDFLGSKRSVQFVDRVTGIGPVKYGVFALTSSAIGDFLICNGITPKKSLTLKVSERLARSPHFWRGVIDGDGTVYIALHGLKPVVRLTSGSFQFIHQFADFCRSVDLRSNVKDAGLSNLGHAPRYIVNFTGKQALDLLGVLYAGATVWLDRKKVKVDEIFAQPVRQKYVRRMAVVAGVRVSASAVQ